MIVSLCVTLPPVLSTLKIPWLDSKLVFVSVNDCYFVLYFEVILTAMGNKIALSLLKYNFNYKF